MYLKNPNACLNKIGAIRANNLKFNIYIKAARLYLQTNDNKKTLNDFNKTVA